MLVLKRSQLERRENRRPLLPQRPPSQNSGGVLKTFHGEYFTYVTFSFQLMCTAYTDNMAVNKD